MCGFFISASENGQLLASCSEIFTNTFIHSSTLSMALERHSELLVCIKYHAVLVSLSHCMQKEIICSVMFSKKQLQITGVII
jgi:hypothetical protein